MNALSPASQPPSPPGLSAGGAGPPPPSFSAALALIPTWADLSKTRRRDLASALNTAAGMLQLPPSAISCDPGWLNARLFDRPPAAFGLGVRRFQNILSGVRAVLRRLGHHAPHVLGDAGLPESWRLLLAGAPHRALGAGLKRFARYCATRGLEPAEVTDPILIAFVAGDTATRIAPGADSRAATLAAGWNRLKQQLAAGTALSHLTAPPRREPYTQPMAAYPESFREDLQLFLDRLAPPDGASMFRAGTAPRRLRPATLKVRAFAIRQASAALVAQGHEPSSLRSLRDLVQPVARAGTILDFYFARAQGRVGGQVATIAETLRQVAKHHAAIPSADLAELERWCSQAQPRRGGMSEKVRDRLRRLTEPHPRALLLHLPNELMRRAERLGAGTADAGRLALLAGALEILLVCPLRMLSLLKLRVDRHLQRADPRRRQRLSHLVLAETETKNAEPMEWPLPADSAALLERYIREFRPALTTPTNPYLFPGSAEGPRSQNALSAGLSQMIWREVGVRVHPHLLRHYAAWLHLQSHPGDYETVRRVLGHRSIETTVSTYCGLEAPAAARRFDAVVLQERKATRAVAQAAWKDPARRKGSLQQRGNGDKVS
jgi:integrase